MAGYCLAAVLAVCAGLAFAAQPAAQARVYFISPLDGETLQGPVTVRFGLNGMGVAPAGVDKPGTGHHHLFVDVDGLPAPDQPIAKDGQHLHFGGGQTETVLDLPPGEHTLRLVFADYNHMPFDPPIVSDLIHITVK
jgi:hypothetical protein